MLPLPPFALRLFCCHSDFDVEGRVQLWTLPHERLLIINFKGKPKLFFGVKLKVHLPEIFLASAIAPSYFILFRQEVLVYRRLRGLLQSSPGSQPFTSHGLKG